MKVFRVKGKFRMKKKKGEWQPFTKEIVEENEDGAVEKVMSLFGSKHRVKRTNIKIREVKEISEDEVENVYIQDLISQED
ncbi:MAG: 50S ribosomal protein L18Ae [Candidatus Natronoplasma sp.]